ncbi:MAG: hypothetical protein HC892_00975 [Saprospiraceae bacterium]|nr:hypothetical protein [Saprospiraceae bacterium]
MLSARGNMLIILSQTGDLLHIHKLSKKIHAQPEGICFDANGDLFIANEAGESTEGKLYRFKSY